VGRIFQVRQIPHDTGTVFKTRVCSRWGAARYGAVLAVSLLWEFRFPYELRLTYPNRYELHGTDRQTDRIDDRYVMGPPSRKDGLITSARVTTGAPYTGSTCTDYALALNDSVTVAFAGILAEGRRANRRRGGYKLHNISRGKSDREPGETERLGQLQLWSCQHCRTATQWSRHAHRLP